MTLDEVKRDLATKHATLIEYRDKIDPCDEVRTHARTMANGRIAQIEMDIRLVSKIEQ